MQNIPVFYDYLWKENFPNETTDLVEKIHKLASTDQFGGVVISNVGGYQSISDVHTMNEFSRLVEIIKIQFKQLHDEIELIEQVEFDILNMWVNVNYPHAFNKFHRHVNPPSIDRIASASVISGTYYVDVPENSGDLVFHAGREDYSLMTHEAAIVRIPELFLKNTSNRHIRPLYKVTPKSGDLFMWWADMIHGVEQNHSNKNRISISFNLGLKLRSAT